MQEIQHESIVSFRKVPKDIQKHYVGNYDALGMEYCELGDLRRVSIANFLYSCCQYMCDIKNIANSSLSSISLFNFEDFLFVPASKRLPIFFQLLHHVSPLWK